MDLPERAERLLGLALVLMVVGLLLSVPGFPPVFIVAVLPGAVLVLFWEHRDSEPLSPRERLVRQLQLAYSGELAAGLAYAGHARSVSDPKAKEWIRKIEDEEWHHRRLVGDMLRELGCEASRARELRAHLVGRFLSLSCHLSPAFLPNYGAGRLERGNVGEYEDAAVLAQESGLPHLIPCLLDMAETEWDHEAYFRGRVVGKAGLRILPLWESLPPKESIRGRSVPS